MLPHTTVPYDVAVAAKPVLDDATTTTAMRRFDVQDLLTESTSSQVRRRALLYQSDSAVQLIVFMAIFEVDAGLLSLGGVFLAELCGSF